MGPNLEVFRLDSDSSVPVLVQKLPVVTSEDDSNWCLLKNAVTVTNTRTFPKLPVPVGRKASHMPVTGIFAEVSDRCPLPAFSKWTRQFFKSCVCRSQTISKLPVLVELEGRLSCRILAPFHWCPCQRRCRLDPSGTQSAGADNGTGACSLYL